MRGKNPPTCHAFLRQVTALLSSWARAKKWRQSVELLQDMKKRLQEVNASCLPGVVFDSAFVCFRVDLKCWTVQEFREAQRARQFMGKGAIGPSSSAFWSSVGVTLPETNS